MSTQALSVDFFGIGEEEDDVINSNAATPALWGRLVCQKAAGGALHDVDLCGERYCIFPEAACLYVADSFAFDCSFVWGKQKNKWTPNPFFFLFDCEQRYTIGRSASECDVRHKTRLLSGKHCSVERREVPVGSGNFCAFLTDLSTNGTWLNNSRLPKEEARMLAHADEIKLVCDSKVSEGIVYIYQDAVKIHEAAAAAHARRLADAAAIVASAAAGQEDTSDSGIVSGSGVLMPPPTGRPVKPSVAASGAGHSDDERLAASYDVLEQLGEGNFAKVRKVLHRATNKYFALKIIDKKQYARQALNYRPDALMDEVKILQKISHPGSKSQCFLCEQLMSLFVFVFLCSFRFF